MTADATIEKVKAVIEEMRELLAKLEAEKATKRNWPERIEAGDCFEQANGSRYLVCGTKFVNLDTGALWLLGGGPSGSDKIDLSYLGKIDLSIRTDAHEPTGAELVGRVCEFADLMSGPWSPGECAAFGQNPAYPYRKAGGAEWKFARLTK